MKKFLPFLVLTFISFQFKAQVVSINGGTWMNPMTWNCTCVPFTGSITVNHFVTLNTSLSFTSGGITINNTGSLIQDASNNRDIWINGGYFNNNGGIANFRYFLVSAGTLSNTGSFTVAAMTNSVAFTNSGTIKMDSMWVAGNLTNATSGKIIGDSLTNASGATLINNGRMMIGAQTNSGTVINNNYMDSYAYTNSGTFNNNDSLMLTWSIWNRSKFTNGGGGKVRLGKTFYNYNSSTTAVFHNDGNVTALDSWYNTDTVKGGSGGYFQVQDTSANSGFMKGNFVFCDLTPPLTSPKIDFNSGPVSPAITYCSVGIEEKELSALSIYPNPSNGKFFIDSEGIHALNVIITDLNGRVVFDEDLGSSNEINFGGVDGIYIMKVTNTQNGAFDIRKLIIQN
jgi:hypothetical protein